MKPSDAFNALNGQMELMNISRTIVICGGSALVALGWIRRETRDVDVIEPILDEALLDAAALTADKLGLDSDWLNNGVSPIKSSLPSGWEARTVTIYQGLSLTVKALGRQDLLSTKLLGACDRGDDISDLVGAEITEEELHIAKSWVLKQDASNIWPRIVDQCIREIIRRQTERID